MKTPNGDNRKTAQNGILPTRQDAPQGGSRPAGRANGTRGGAQADGPIIGAQAGAQAVDYKNGQANRVRV